MIKWRVINLRAKYPVLESNSADALNTVADAISHFPGGAKIEQIEAALAARLPRRTLQRRLADLIRQQRVHTQGVGRATRYLRRRRGSI